VRIEYYHVDAFTDKVFGGNPAGVCLLENPLAETVMQKIAFENNLSETAFIISDKDSYQIRWFTPQVEVDLCGHATLAAAKILFEYTDFYGNEIEFFSPRSGSLPVILDKNGLKLVFPKDTLEKIQSFPMEIEKGLKGLPNEVYKGKTDYLCVFERQSDIEKLDPDLEIISRLQARGIIVTSPGDRVDFVSRFFAPQSGIPEDPVTGSAHTTLTPFWVDRLNKNPLNALQLSARGGKLQCKLDGEKVEITGNAVVFLEGEIIL
jgi:PhzF family phenazine biosynthesis protein